MPKKRNSLEDIFSNVTTPEPASRSKPAKRKSAQAQSKSDGSGGRRPHFKQPALYLRIPVHRQLRMLAFEEDKKMHDLFMEALDMLLADRGLPSIAELESNEIE